LVAIRKGRRLCNADSSNNVEATMSKIVTWCSLSLVSALLALGALPAHAQNMRSWVSRFGNDANTCTIGAPCLTFNGALAKTNAGGFINCLDAGDFGGGGVAITKSITVDCMGTFAGVLATAGGFGILINASATDVVRLRGLSIEGAGAGNLGVFASRVGALRIEQCKIFGFVTVGIGSEVPTGVGSELYVSDSVISENGTTGTDSGILVRTSGTATARVSLGNVKLDNNNNGLLVQTLQGSTGQISLSMRDSTAAGNGNTGITVQSLGATIVTALDNVTATTNSTGLLVDGSATRVLITRLTAIVNFIGLSTVNSGVIVSYGDNHINNNISVNGTPTVLQTPQ
jgi:hypothetical protein